MLKNNMTGYAMLGWLAVYPHVRGNGIGLAVANEIMELHSGSLDIDSQEGIGTTVIITIPTMKKLETNPELSNTTKIPSVTGRVQVVERKQDD